MILTFASSVFIKIKNDDVNNFSDSKKTVAKQQIKVETEQKTADQVTPKSNTEIKKIETQEYKKYILPTTGEISVGFSPDELIYNSTTKDWRVHCGIDFDVPESAIVKSMNDGKIIEIRNDELYGCTVSIEHQNGIVIKYANIEICEEIIENTKVKQGMLIGYIKNNPSIENLQPLHLHLEVYKDGLPSDLSVLEF